MEMAITRFINSPFFFESSEDLGQSSRTNIYEEKNVAKNFRLSNDELINALRSKKSDGYEALYNMYSTTLYGVILKIIPETAIAEDLLSEVFIKIVNSFDQYDSSKGRLYTWIINITRNSCFDTLRTREYKNNKKNQSLEETDSIENQHNTSFNPELIDLKRLVNRLSEEDKQLIDMAYFKELSRKEMAILLRMPVGTVKTRLRSAINALRLIFNYNKPERWA
jgi:RNA polymerase sigma-70 factor (ECF subfamily)